MVITYLCANVSCDVLKSSVGKVKEQSRVDPDFRDRTVAFNVSHRDQGGKFKDGTEASG